MAAVVLALWLSAASATAVAAPVLPSGFQDSTLPFEGLTPGQGLEEPTAVRFAPDGKVFVAEMSGKILVFDSLADHEPTLFADLRTEVFNANDRGLLGLALDPEFTTGRPYVYALYAYDAPPGQEAPHWGNPGEDGDECSGVGQDDCVIQGRLSRLTANLATDESTAKKTLVTGWCQQFSSHSVGDLEFDVEGNLWASGGEGASFTKVDWGQYGEPPNPCGDPPAGFGGNEEPPEAEGGALRSQNAQKLSGKLIRINPDTGEGVPGNPLFASLGASENERRIVGKGFRNPFRFAIDPETKEVYVDNVGSSVYEEIDRVAPSPSSLFNSGWPCYEGPERRELYEFRGLKVCEHLYENPGLTSQPFFYYSHESGVTPEDPCPYEPGSAISGLAFYEGSQYPGYHGALFFADAVRGCVYVMRTGEDGRPDPSKVEPFLTEGGLYPGVDIETGPEGDLFYVSLYGPEYSPGAIHRIHYDPEAPQARLKADQVSGAAPLTVHFDAGESSDPQGQPLEYEWDLNGDGNFDSPTTASTKTESYAGATNRTAAVRVVDPGGHKSVAQLTVYPGDTPPQPKIEEPSDGLRWHVGQAIPFAGSATEGEGEPLARARLYWRSRLYHCPGGPESCHAHPLQVFPARESGTLIAPDHDLPSHIELSLTATDARGLSATTSVNLYPNVSFLGMRSDPPGIVLSAGLQTEATPFGVEAIEGSGVTLTAPATAEVAGKSYVWKSWSDGGARVHTVDAKAGAANYTAEYALEGEAKPEEPTPPASPPPVAEIPPPAIGPPAPQAPKVTLQAHPPKTTRSTTARYSFSARGSDFECKLDKGPYRACRSPKTYKHLKPGSHSFAVVAIAGGAQGKPAKFNWKVLKPNGR
jgi:glucose/arabinose dehydrogenase